MGSKVILGHLRSLSSSGQDNWPLYPHTLMDFHGTWTSRYWGRGTYVTVILRSSRSHLRSLTPKWSRYIQLVTVSTYFDGFSWDLDNRYWGRGTYVTLTQRSSEFIDPKMVKILQLVTVSTYFDGFSWDLDKQILLQGHTPDSNYFLEAVIDHIVQQRHILLIA